MFVESLKDGPCLVAIHLVVRQPVSHEETFQGFRPRYDKTTNESLEGFLVVVKDCPTSAYSWHRKEGRRSGLAKRY